MPATPVPPWLPGVRATTLILIPALIYGALFLPLFALVIGLIGLMTSAAILSGGHLPWPIAQWALTNPAGLLVLLAIGVGVSAPAFILVQRHVVRHWTLARAVDVTEVPPWIWLTHPPVYPATPRPIAGSDTAETPAWSV